MIQQIILVLGEGLAIGFLLGIAAILLFSEHLQTEQVKCTCVARLAEPPQDLTPISRQHCSYSIQNQCELWLREIETVRHNKRRRQMADYNRTSVAILTAQDGTYQGDSWLLGYQAQTTIGSVKDCDIVIEDHDISRLHAQITHRINIITTHEFAIFDYSSTSNTRVNGQPINGVAFLKDGDQVQIGKREFLFRSV